MKQITSFELAVAVWGPVFPPVAHLMKRPPFDEAPAF